MRKPVNATKCRAIITSQHTFGCLDRDGQHRWRQEGLSGQSEKATGLPETANAGGCFSDDQMARGGGRPALLHLLPYISCVRHHDLPPEAAARAPVKDRGARV